MTSDVLGRGLEPAALTPQNAAAQLDLDTAFAQLMAGDPQGFYDRASIWDRIANDLGDHAGRFANEVRNAEQIWQGQGWNAYANNSEDLSQHLTTLNQALLEPGYANLLRQLGDTLSSGQQRMQDLKNQRDEASASDPGQALGDKNRYDYLAQQIMQDVQNSYVQVGLRFNELPSYTFLGNHTWSLGAPPPPPEITDTSTTWAGTGYRHGAGPVRDAAGAGPAAYLCGVGLPLSVLSGPALGRPGPTANGVAPDCVEAVESVPGGARPIISGVLGAGRRHGPRRQGSGEPDDTVELMGLVPMHRGVLGGARRKSLAVDHETGPHEPAAQKPQAKDGCWPTVATQSGINGGHTGPRGRHEVDLAAEPEAAATPTQPAPPSTATALSAYSDNPSGPAGSSPTNEAAQTPAVTTPTPTSPANSLLPTTGAASPDAQPPVEAPTASAITPAASVPQTPATPGTSPQALVASPAVTPNPASPYPVSPANQATLDMATNQTAAAPVGTGAGGTTAPMGGSMMGGGMGMAGRMPGPDRQRTVLFRAASDTWGPHDGLPTALGRPEPIPELAPIPDPNPPGKE